MPSIFFNKFLNKSRFFNKYFFYLILEKTLNSIQNQKYINDNDYEIILIYDNNIDNNFYLLKQCIKKYLKLKLLYNNKRKGLLYSYSLGVLESNGEYILLLKTGETLSKKNILNKFYDKIINNTYDVLEFNLLINNNITINRNSLKLYKCQHIQSELNISIFKYNNNYKELDQEKELLTNKLIKATLFKKIINKYKLN
jgi:cellulose synthase/poly-beta-1,6-N-acetylglucosamine synthase-like glycosyltransferase